MEGQILFCGYTQKSIWPYIQPHRRKLKLEKTSVQLQALPWEDSCDKTEMELSFLTSIPSLFIYFHIEVI